MRKFFSFILFALFAVSLFTMTGCAGWHGVVCQCDTPNYSYTIIREYPGTFTFEFKPGTPEQRQDPKKMPFYKKGVITGDAAEKDAYVEIANCIYEWEKIQQKQ